MKNIKELRDDIDFIDQKILTLLQKRIEVVGEISQYKKNHDLKIHDPQREAEHLKDLSLLMEPNTAPFLLNVFQEIIKQSKEYQKTMR